MVAAAFTPTTYDAALVGRRFLADVLDSETGAVTQIQAGTIVGYAAGTDLPFLAHLDDGEPADVALPDESIRLGAVVLKSCVCDKCKTVYGRKGRILPISTGWRRR